MTSFTYPRVGATRDLRHGGEPPPGYHLLRVRADIGHGRDTWERAVRAVLRWEMHRAAGLRVRADTDEAVPGATVTVGLGIGPLRLPATSRVVWTIHEPDAAGFGYGTLTGNPVRGEEAFVVERHSDDRVSLDVTAFSRGAVWYTRVAGPFGRAAQRVIAHSYARGLGRLCRRGSQTS
ncbi:DUF1990 domain-containing protein [Streptomyces sp. RFCAC02]|uniref:DUF1990 family protein n=1 Tax=Streptomyces sp. RFCAC02 TaxID=2499143 RepID=UPI00102115E5|nr:DUF1990 domain-containing protein [Streptomyces sp. RFCAC02]